MISSPSLRSVPTLKSAESESPSAGRLFCASAGASQRGSAERRTTRSSERRSAGRGAQRGTDRTRRDVAREGASAMMPHNRSDCFATHDAVPADRMTAADALRRRRARRTWSTCRARRRRTASRAPAARIRMLPATLALIAGGQREQGRRARRRAHRRDPGRQAHRRADPAVPSAADHAGRGRVRDRPRRRASVRCTAQVETLGRTGVEMEALTAVQVGLLTVYDMCKAADRGMVMGEHPRAREARRQVGRLGRGDARSSAARAQRSRRSAVGAAAARWQLEGAPASAARNGPGAPSARPSQGAKNSADSALRNSRSRCGEVARPRRSSPRFVRAPGPGASSGARRAGSAGARSKAPSARRHGCSAVVAAA